MHQLRRCPSFSSSTAGVNRSQADQINDKGNNGKHFGWDKNGNGQVRQNTNYTSNTSGNYTNGQSVPGPDSLVLLGVGLSGLVILEKDARESLIHSCKTKLNEQGWSSS
jgi:hypothetical protein